MIYYIVWKPLEKLENNMVAQELFHEIANNPFSYVESWKNKTGGKVIGYFCSYVPEEIITAAGMLPVRIFGQSDQIEMASSYLQSYSCSFIKSALEDGLSKKYDLLDGIIFPQTCDSIQRLSDIWRMNIKTPFHHDIILPAKLNSESSINYIKELLHVFVEAIENFFGRKIDSEDLKKSIHLSNVVKNTLKQLYEIRMSGDGLIRSKDISAIFKASMVMDRESFTNLFLSYVKELSEMVPEKSDPKRIMLAGGFCSISDFYQIIEESGGLVVWDDFCTGARYFEGKISETEEPVSAIAQRFANRVVCPAKHMGLRTRGDYIIDRALKTRSDGVILVSLKFCDPHAFDIPYLRDMLEKENIPHMVLELEDSSSSVEQIRTRCEAFIEMI